jgi:hypothetical protein
LTSGLSGGDRNEGKKYSDETGKHGTLMRCLRPRRSYNSTP